MMGWSRRRRWVIGAVLVGLVAGAGGVVTAVTLWRDSPEDVVREYLEVLQAGDAEAAREYAAVVPEFDAASDEFLVAEAMSRDWRVTQVVRRHSEWDDPATVDVTITAADGTARQGRFQLDRGEDGWTIRNPLIKLNLSLLPLKFVELNGVTANASVVWLFPGAYQAYTSVSDLFTFSAPTFVAVPHTAGDSGVVIEEHYLPQIGFTDGFDAVLQEQVAAWIEECAASADPFPDGCPFTAGDPDYREIRVDRDRYSTVGDATVTWEVVSQPVVRLTQGNGAFDVLLVRPGEVRISGTAPRRLGEQPEDFRGTCHVLMDGVRATTPRAGEFAFHVGETTGWFACSRYINW